MVLELLAPAGDYNAFLAAINNGADAVYLGGPGFHARNRAASFSLQELKMAINYAHERNRKVYITVNTLIAHTEMDTALDYIFELYQLQADAVIIQDVGLMHRLSLVLPEIKVHASTQTTIHNAAGIQLLSALGVKRVVLARELSDQDMQLMRIRQANEVEWEVFVHGALCYAYSGQCLMSSLIGGRSGNRGQCAQPCRLPYQLYREGEKQILSNDGNYLLSMADLCLLQHLPRLQQVGVTALKIEGRLKRAEYVAVVTRAYRQALDQMADENKQGPEDITLRQVFNRNLTSSYFIGSNRILSPLRPDNRGEEVGDLRVAGADRVEMCLTQAINQQDGLVIRDEAGNSLANFCLLDCHDDQIKTETTEAGQSIALSCLGSRIPSGSKVFRTHNHTLMLSVKSSLREQKAPTLGLTIKAIIRIGMPVILTGEDEIGTRAEVVSKKTVESAVTAALTAEAVQDKLARLGNTVYHLATCNLELDEAAMFPFSELNQLRRELILALDENRKPALQPMMVNHSIFLSRKNRDVNISREIDPSFHTLLTVLVNDIQSAEKAAQAGADVVYLDLSFLNPTEQKKVGKLYENFIAVHKKLVLVLPPICHEHQDLNLQELIQLPEIEVMVSHWGDLEWAKLAGKKIWVNDSLPVLNHYTMDFIQQYAAVCRVTLSPELTWEEIRTFPHLRQAECIIHGELPLMISRACLLSNHLAENPKECISICQRNKLFPPAYFLQDRKGNAFPLQNSQLCLQYIYNARTHCLIEYLSRFLSAGLGSLRIEARCYTPQQTEAITCIYREAFDTFYAKKNMTTERWRKELLQFSNSSFTNGHYFRGVKKPNE